MPTLNKATLQAMRPEIQAALDAVAKKHGLKKLELGNCRFDPEAGSFKYSLEGTIGGGLNADEARYDRSRAEWHTWWPERGQPLAMHKDSVILGMTKGGRVTFRKWDGKEYVLKTGGMEKIYPMPKEIGDERFANARVSPPIRGGE